MNIRYFGKTMDSALVIAEVAPQSRTVIFCGTRYRLDWPWLQFHVRFYKCDWQYTLLGLGVSFTKRRLSNFRSPIYGGFIPNQTGYNLCVGEFVLTYHPSVEKLVMRTISHFWLSGFTMTGSESFRKWLYTKKPDPTTKHPLSGIMYPYPMKHNPLVDGLDLQDLVL